MRDSMMILQLLRDDLVIWSGEMQRGERLSLLLLLSTSDTFSIMELNNLWAGRIEALFIFLVLCNHLCRLSSAVF